MGPFRSLFKVAVCGAAAGTGGFWYFTKDSTFVPLSTSDYLFNSAYFQKFNPSKNPTTHDYCVKRVPLSKLDKRLQKPDGSLVDAFCASVWGGLGYSFQRAFLAHKYESPQTTQNLWSTSQLRSSKYPVGTQITDHFEVLEHTPTRIVVRCGDSPSNRDVRESDGLFELSAVVKPEENVAEFGLKSVFYQGQGKAEAEPMPRHIVWLHKQYTKLWMETALLRLQR